MTTLYAFAIISLTCAGVYRLPVEPDPVGQQLRQISCVVAPIVVALMYWCG